MNIICQLLEAKTLSEVHKIEREAKEILPKIQHYNLVKWVNRTSIRIARVEAEKKKSFAELNN